MLNIIIKELASVHMFGQNQNFLDYLWVFITLVKDVCLSLIMMKNIF